MKSLRLTSFIRPTSEPNSPRSSSSRYAFKLKPNSSLNRKEYYLTDRRAHPTTSHARIPIQKSFTPKPINSDQSQLKTSCSKVTFHQNSNLHLTRKAETAKRFDFEEYLREMTYMILDPAPVKSTLEYKNKLHNVKNQQEWKKQFLARKKKKNELKKEWSKMLANYEIREGFRLADFASHFECPFMSHSEDLFKFEQILMVSLTNRKFMVIPIKSCYNYHELIRNASLILNDDGDQLESKMLFCGLIGCESECFFWVGKPTMSYQREAILSTIKKFLFQDQTVEEYQKARVFERIYIVDWSSNLSFVQLYESDLKGDQEQRNLVKGEQKGSDGGLIEKKRGYKFFTKKIFTNKILREGNAIY